MRSFRRAGIATVAIVLASVSFTACGGNGSGLGGAPPLEEPPSEGQRCNPASDSCAAAHTQLFAISHAFVDPTNTVYYRVTVPARSTGTDWGDGTNGFFYQAVVNGSTTSSYVPFRTASPSAMTTGRCCQQFSFIVAADVSAGEQNTTLEGRPLRVRLSDRQQPDVRQASVDRLIRFVAGPVGRARPRQRSVQLLIAAERPLHRRDGLDCGGAGQRRPSGRPGGLPIREWRLVVRGAGRAQRRAAAMVLRPCALLRLDGKPYTNDIFNDSAEHRSIGVLTLQEAAFPISATEYRTRYGSTTAITARE